MELLSDEDFEGEDLERFHKANKSRHRNAELMTELGQKFGQEPDVTNARMDYFMAGLVHLGVLDKSDYTSLISWWESDLTKQLQSMRDRMENELKKQQAAHAQRVREENARRKAKIATPVKGIVLPNGGIHKVPDKEG